MRKPFVRSAFNYDRLAASFSVSTVNSAPDKTIQSDKSDTDIPTMMRKFASTGVLPNVRTLPPGPQAFEGIFDFQSAMNVIRQANEAFAELPSLIRERFANDPARYLEFVHNPDNAEEMVKLGIAKKIPVPEVPPPMKVEVVNPSPEKK